MRTVERVQTATCRMRWTIGNLLGFFLLLLIAASFAQASDFCPNGCRCDPKRTSLECTGLEFPQLSAILNNHSFVDSYNTRLFNLSLVNCSLSDVNVLPLPLIRGLLYLDLSHNELNDFKFESPSHFMPLLIALKLTGNHLVGISRTLFSSVPNVEEVVLDGNKIFTIDWEAFRLYKLKRLWIARNNLLSINEHILRFSRPTWSLPRPFRLATNQLSSSFFSARRLVELNLSHNRIQRLDYDSFVPLHQLQTLDLSFNNFSEVPVGLTQFVGLRVLNFSGNPITRLRSGDFRLPVLQVIVVSSCPLLRILESKSFMEMPNIQTVEISHNPQLQFIFAVCLS
ncbi:Ig-like domain-containing protein [Aphelenchoides fujianensis]|nr:Ig-like domain-containing protein [Aphelenchoides fujianensis]